MSTTIIILTWNEEKNISQALNSIQWCDDVIVVDSYSTDRTEEICRTYKNVRFYQNKFIDLASQRQYALDNLNPKYEWVFGLDADEIITSELATELMSIAEQYKDGDPIAYDVAMRIYMWGKWLRFSSEYPRFWRRYIHRKYCRYVQRGHADTIEAFGTTGRLRSDLIHEDQKGLSDWLDKHNKYTTQEARYALNELRQVNYLKLLSRDRLERRQAQKRFFRSLVGNSYLRFLHLYFLRLGFLDGWRGFALCRLRAHQHFIIRLKQFELSEREKITNPMKNTPDVRLLNNFPKE